LLRFAFFWIFKQNHYPQKRRLQTTSFHETPLSAQKRLWVFCLTQARRQKTTKIKENQQKNALFSRKKQERYLGVGYCIICGILSKCERNITTDYTDFYGLKKMPQS